MQDKVLEFYEKNWVKDGFSFSLISHHKNFSCYDVSKDGYTYMVEVKHFPFVENIEEYYKNFVKAHNLAVELKRIFR